MDKSGDVERDVSIKELFSKISAEFPKERRIYTARLVCFLLLQQRLNSWSAQGVVAECVNTDLYREFFGDCLRKRSREKLSTSSSAYIQAKQALPKERLLELHQRLFAELADIPKEFDGRRVFVVDGTEIKLKAEPSLRKQYPPSSNSFGLTQFPLLRVVLIHDAFTGVAYAPSWSAGRGENGRGEVSLALEQLQTVERNSILVGDRNFGTFVFCSETKNRGSDVVVRLTEPRANKLLKEAKQTDNPAPDISLDWNISKADKMGNPHLAADTKVSGRFIRAWVKKEGASNKQLLLLFTTLSDYSPAEIISLYARRWKIELDIRDLKKTCGLDQLTSLTTDSIEKELLAGVLAYNLVRAVMILAAKKYNLSPREMSFKLTFDLMRATFGTRLILATSLEEQQKIFSQLLDAIGRTPIRKRPPRNYKREAFKKTAPFPIRKPRI